MSNVIGNNDPQNTNFCSCEIEQSAKGARVKVRMIRTDLDYEHIVKDLPKFYNGVLERLVERGMKVDDYQKPKVEDQIIDINPNNNALESEIDDLTEKRKSKSKDYSKLDQ